MNYSARFISSSVVPRQHHGLEPFPVRTFISSMKRSEFLIVDQPTLEIWIHQRALWAISTFSGVTFDGISYDASNP